MGVTISEQWASREDSQSNNTITINNNNTINNNTNNNDNNDNNINTNTNTNIHTTNTDDNTITEFSEQWASHGDYSIACQYGTLEYSLIVLP